MADVPPDLPVEFQDAEVARPQPNVCEECLVAAMPNLPFLERLEAEFFRARTQPRDIEAPSPTVLALTESVMRESTAASVDLAALKASLVEVAGFLCTPDGRTHESCANVASLLDSPEAWRRVNRNRARWLYLPEEFQQMLDLLSWAQFTFTYAIQNENFDATPELLLASARALRATRT